MVNGGRRDEATLDRVRLLAARGELEVSDHAYDRISNLGLLVSDLFASISSGEPIEDYPDYHAGPCVLVLQQAGSGALLHALWGLRKGADRPAVLVTAYKPDPTKWSADFRRRL